MTTDEERIALFLDYENLAIGARDKLAGIQFDFRPVAAALAERGRVVVRKAYADWSFFSEDRRMLVRNHVELVEMPQRMGSVRKNAADIKMAVDAMEYCFGRDYISTFVIATGDSDFTPLVYKLRELNKRVIGIGVQASTSKLLPPACDEFLFYERLEGVEVQAPARRRVRSRKEGATRAEEPVAEPVSPAEIATSPAEMPVLATLISQTLAGMQRSSSDVVGASMLKRALLRKDPTFTESDYGFRAFGELLRFLERRGVVELGEGQSKGDPAVGFPEQGGGEHEAFALLRSVVSDLEAAGETPLMSGLKDQMRKRRPSFSEKEYGYGGFLQFCRAASNGSFVTLAWEDRVDDYVLHPSPV